MGVGGEGGRGVGGEGGRGWDGRREGGGVTDCRWCSLSSSTILA